MIVWFLIICTPVGDMQKCVTPQVMPSNAKCWSTGQRYKAARPGQRVHFICRGIHKKPIDE